jgi:hypothetical protein
MFLAVPPQLAERALSRWRDLGGSSAAVLPRGEGTQVTFIVPDQESPDGRALTVLSGELGVMPAGPALLNMAAVYDESDVEQAELVFLQAGSLADAVDPGDVTSAEACPRCGLPVRARPREAQVRLHGKDFTNYDLFRAELLWFVSKPLADILSSFRGAAPTPTNTPEGAPSYFELTADASLGYPSDGVMWGPPCDLCGRRKGEAVGVYVNGMHSYPRRAWDGSDFLTSAIYPEGLFVTQRALRVLSDARWRIPDPGVRATPVQLDDDAEPVF